MRGEGWVGVGAAVGGVSGGEGGGGKVGSGFAQCLPGRRSTSGTRSSACGVPIFTFSL